MTGICAQMRKQKTRTGPSIVGFRSRPLAQNIMQFVDALIPRCFRVYRRDQTFVVWAPRPESPDAPPPRCSRRRTTAAESSARSSAGGQAAVLARSGCSDAHQPFSLGPQHAQQVEMDKRARRGPNAFLAGGRSPAASGDTSAAAPAERRRRMTWSRSCPTWSQLIAARTSRTYSTRRPI